ncbi:hypothetical protein O6H91_06G013900 [Diphasiastrum complanatum]|uniref:Uncharacterized protein n=1 Tax=Diphasiastrum complanatum TaxID=34168 RepID=A0ACC2DBA9_DIPCM|nr:hypothetical protein O6H91_06G013900 [Diphasiastrum complanatum]
MADDQPPPEATTDPPPPASAPLTPPPFLSFLPFNQQIPSPFWQQIPLPFPIVNLQPHSQINHGGVPYVAMPVEDAQRGVVASRSASVPGIVQARKLLPPSSSAQLGGHVAVPSQASVAGMQLFAESPESTLLDPQTSPPPPSSGLHTSNLRPRLPQAETHVPSMRSSYHQQIYPPPLAAHQDVVADRRLFFSTLTKFHAFFETQLVIPKVEGDELDLHLLYCLVTANGGLEQVIKLKKWNHIFAAFGLPTRVLSQPYFFRKHYSNLLHHYEQVYFFRREGELVPPPVPLPSPNLLSPSQFHDQQLSYPVGENLEPVKKRRRKRFDRVEMLEADAGKLVGRVVNGAIDGKFEHGYLVTVHVGTEKLRGILYNVPVVNNTQQFAAVPELKNNVGVPASSSSFQVGLPCKRRGKVSKRDPNAPRLNRSGYNFFFAEQRSRLKHLGSENAEITRIIGDMWQRLTEQERSHIYFEDRAIRNDIRRKRRIIMRGGNCSCSKDKILDFIEAF